MTTFEILTIAGSAILIIGGLVAIYIRVMVSIAKIEVELVEVKRDLIQKEIAILLIEKNNRDDFKENREDHKQILNKVGEIMKILIK
jgi:hypothetical protein